MKIVRFSASFEQIGKYEMLNLLNKIENAWNKLQPTGFHLMVSFNVKKQRDAFYHKRCDFVILVSGIGTRGANTDVLPSLDSSFIL